MNVIHLNQKQLAMRWAVSEATLERGRSVGIGPVYLKLSGHPSSARRREQNGCNCGI